MTTPQIIAHRGASYLAPENTLVAFRKAMEIGADGVEMDVQKTYDNELSSTTTIWWTCTPTSPARSTT